MNKLLVTRLRAPIVPPQPRQSLALALLHPRSELVAIDADPFTMGRDGACSLALDDTSVSRIHAEIRRPAGEFWLADLDSTNGTFLNRARLTEALRLSPGDTIRLGEVVMKLVALPDPAASAPGALGPLVGGASLGAVFRQIRLLAPTELRILITGESGTGKELVARELHQRSGRAGPFIAVNCAALPEALVESELFGHQRGAFTGALADKPGLFEAAGQGTLFLDEVGELPLATQAKLLRVVETNELRRLGSVRSLATSCRIISATNRDLPQAVAERSFRGDLLARLAESEIRLPPLRERTEDLPALLAALAGRSGRALVLGAEAMEALACYQWPLNIRELDNVIRTLGALFPQQEIELAHLPPQLWVASTPSPQPATSADALSTRILAGLRAHQGNVRKTAQALGLSRAIIYRCLSRLGKRPDEFRDGTDRA